MKTREEYLLAVAVKAEVELFEPNGYTLPKYRVTCGFPHKGAFSLKRGRIGECWYPEASKDQTTEIIVSMTVDDSSQAIGVLLHEMVHAAVGCGFGHGPVFRKCALSIGLTGKMTSTTESQELIENFINPAIKELGEYPHAKIDYSQRKKQSTRMIKVECNNCGIKFRASRTVADQCHVCPVCEEETLIIG
jgi:predicted Zn-ribbon and HTH transcriptional regulator